MIQVLFMLLVLGCHLNLSAKTLVVASSEGPPHTINSEEGLNGIDLDIVKAVLNMMGHQVKFEFMGLKRAHREVLLGRVDAMAPIFSTQDIEGFYISDPIVAYRPMVFSLKENQFTPDVLLDLQGYSLVTFQGAPGYFGEDFLYLAETQFYQEMADMGIIPELLIKARYDFAVLDFYMFYYFYRLQDKALSTSIFTEHELIAPVSASVGFHSSELRDEFNLALEQFLQTDGYQTILTRYLGEGIQVPEVFLRPAVPKLELEPQEDLFQEHFHQQLESNDLDSHEFGIQKSNPKK